MDCFSHVSLAPLDPVLGLTVAFLEDPRPHKVNLGVGVFREENLKTPVLKSVKEAERVLLKEEMTKEYLPIAGLPIFAERMGELVFGKELWEKERKKIDGFQSVGGTGALRIGAKFLKRECEKEVFIPQETWANHRGVFSDAFLKVSAYPYYDAEKGCVAFEKMLGFLKEVPEGSIVLLHACCHNPTGADLNQKQWEEMAALCEKKKFIPFLDFAYQGFGRGLEEDAFAPRLFLKRGFSFLMAASCSKNFGLYAERVGILFVVTEATQVAHHVWSRMNQLIRTDYTTPPLHGASIVAHILGDKELKRMWEEELDAMRTRITAMRDLFSKELTRATKKRDYRFLQDTFGMFAFCHLEKEQTERLISEHAIYMMSGGRLNLCGLNESNLPRVVEAIASVL